MDQDEQSSNEEEIEGQEETATSDTGTVYYCGQCGGFVTADICPH